MANTTALCVSSIHGNRKMERNVVFVHSNIEVKFSWLSLFNEHQQRLQAAILAQDQNSSISRIKEEIIALLLKFLTKMKIQVLFQEFQNQLGPCVWTWFGHALFMK